MLVKLLRLAAGSGCSLSLYGSPARETFIIAGNPQLALDLKIDRDALLLESESEKKIISLCEDGSILYYDNCLYLPEKEYICNILPFYSTLFTEEEKILEFRGENKE